MKKLIVISVIFAIMIGLGVWEMVFTAKLYGFIFDELCSVEEITGDAPKQVDTEEILFHLDRISEKWTKNKGVLFCLGNHTVLRAVDEKLGVLDATCRSNDYTAAPAALRSAKNLVKAISNDAVPVPTNFF